MRKRNKSRALQRGGPLSTNNDTDTEIWKLQEEIGERWHPNSYEECVSQLLHDFYEAAENPRKFLETLRARKYFLDLTDRLFKKGEISGTNKTS